MNLTNKILFLIILLFMINYMTDGKIMETLSKYFSTCKEKMGNIFGFYDISLSPNKENYDKRGLTRDNNIDQLEHTTPNIPYAGQRDFPYLNGNDMNKLDPDTYSLYKFLDSRKTHNAIEHVMTADNSKEIEAPENMIKYIFKSLDKIFNNSGFKFTNIMIVEKIYYTKNVEGLRVTPFKFTANVNYRGNDLGFVVIMIESFLEHMMKGEQINITEIKLIERKPAVILKPKPIKSLYKVKFDEEEKIEIKQKNKAIVENKKLNDKMNEAFNEHFVALPDNDADDIFIRPTNNNNNNNDDDLIPSVVNLSSYEEESQTNTSQ